MHNVICSVAKEILMLNCLCSLRDDIRKHLKELPLARRGSLKGIKVEN